MEAGKFLCFHPLEKRKLDWETVESAGGGTEAEYLQRKKVPGGWIYRNQITEYNGKTMRADDFYLMCFVPETLKAVEGSK